MIEDMPKNRSISNLNHRLRLDYGLFRQAGAEPAGEDHNFHGEIPAFRGFLYLGLIMTTVVGLIYLLTHFSCLWVSSSDLTPTGKTEKVHACILQRTSANEFSVRRVSDLVTKTRKPLKERVSRTTEIAQKAVV